MFIYFVSILESCVFWQATVQDDFLTDSIKLSYFCGFLANSLGENNFSEQFIRCFFYFIMYVSLEANALQEGSYLLRHDFLVC